MYGLTTLNKPKSHQVSTNDGNIFNAAVPTSVELKTNANNYVIIVSIFTFMCVTFMQDVR